MDAGASSGQPLSEGGTAVMVGIQLMEGRYLSKRNDDFIRVRLYVCRKPGDKHLFEIPDSAELQSESDKELLRSLNEGKCPICDR